MGGCSLRSFNCFATIELEVKGMKIRYIITPLFVVLSLVMSTGCELIPTIESSPEAPPSSPATSETQETTPIAPVWELSPSEGQASPLPTIADVVAKVKPSVVAINTEVVTFDFFNQPFTQEGAGSGWIISEDGIIITNNHVVQGAESITVTLKDGRTLPVDMNTVATDVLTDIAVLKIEAENLPAVTVGDSDKLRVGEWVVAIGNALGLGISATHGIVSRMEVSLEVSAEETLYGLVQTNAAINQGNSGGPLVNTAGEVIGITSAKISAAGVEGMGYAISSSEAMPIIQQLINMGYVVRPWLGVGLYPVTDYVVWRYGLAVSEGVLLTEVADNSPASEARLKAGDVIVRFGDAEITSLPELTRAIHSAEIGEEVEITFWRGDTRQTAVVVLAESPPPK